MKLDELDIIIKDADENGLITTTYKQMDKILRNKEDELDKRKPWKQDNIVLLPL